MWALKLILVSLSLCISQAPMAAAGDGYLELYADTANFLIRTNLAHTEALRDCACYLLQKRKESHSSCQKQSKPEFIEHGINFYGETFRKTLTCEAVMQRMVLDPIEENYNIMRAAMVLMKPEIMLNNRSDAALSESFATFEFGSPKTFVSPEYKLDRSPRHEIKQNLLYRKAPLKHPRPLSLIETQKYLKIYGDFGQSTCERIITKKLLAPALARKYNGITPVSICRSMYYSPKGVALKLDFPGTFEEIKKTRQKHFRSIFAKSYYELVQSTPLLALVSGPTPSLKELVTGLDYLASNAADRWKDAEEKFASGEYKFFQQFDFAQRYAHVRWTSSGKSAALFEKNYSNNMEELRKREQAQFWIEMGMVIASNIACSLPWGKGISVMAAALKVGCYTGVGIALNTYYFYDSLTAYDLAVRNLFSTYDARYSYTEAMARMNGEELNVLLNGVFLPIGLGLKETKKAGKLLKTNLILKDYLRGI